MTALCQGPHDDERTCDPGLAICRRCRHLSLVAIRVMPQTYTTLGLQLIPTNKHGQPITMTRNPGINLDQRVVAARAGITAYLRVWAALVAAQNKLTDRPSSDDHAALSALLTRHHDQTCTWPIAHIYATQAITIASNCRKLIDDNPVRTYPIGKCPECDGTLIAQMRPNDPLLPAIIVCDRSPTDDNGQPSHAWTADRWTTLGKAIQ